MKKEKQLKLELLVLPILIIFTIKCIIVIGFNDIYSILFTSLNIIFLPIEYITVKFIRKTYYMIKRGYIIYEN